MSYRNFISKAIELLDKAKLDPDLTFVIEKVQNVEIRDVINGSNDVQEINMFLGEKLRCLRKYKLPYDTTIVDAEVDYISNIIFTEINWLRDGLQNNEPKLLFAFLITNTLLDVELDKIPLLDITNIDLTSTTVQEMVKLLFNFKINITLPSDTPYREKMLYEKYNKGLRDKNVNQMFDFIDAYDKSGRSFIPPIMEQVIRTLAVLSEEPLNKVIIGKDSPLEIEVFLRSLPFEISAWMKLAESNNYILLFAILKKVATRNNHLDLEKIELVSKCLIGLAKLDEEYFITAIRIFKYSYLFYAGILNSLQRLEDKFTLIFCNTFELTKTNDDMKYNEKLLEYTISHVNKDTIVRFEEHLYKKYLDYLEYLLSQKETVQQQVLTDWVPFILHYIKTSFDPRFVQCQLDLAINSLSANSYIWHNSQTDSKSGFYVQFTKVYLYVRSLSEIGYRIHSPNQEKVLNIVLNDGRIWLEYFKESIQPDIIIAMFRMYYSTKLLNKSVKTNSWNKRRWLTINSNRRQ